jgi:uncharacterized protein
MTEEKPDIFDAVARGDAAAVRAVIAEDPEQLKKLNAGKITALHRAVMQSDAGMTELLLSMGADADAPDGLQSTPLHRAVIMNHSEITGILVSRGALLSPVDRYGLTPLCIAAREGFCEIAKLLMAKGADLRGGPNELGLTPLHRAVLQGSRDMVKLLIAKGAGINAKDASGITPYRIARRLGLKEIAEVLKRYGGKR